MHPTMRTNFGFSTPEGTMVSDGSQTASKESSVRCRETKRSMACKKMLTPSAKRKTPLKKAPSN